MRRGRVGVFSMVMASGACLLLVGSGCKSGPCSGLGMTRDERPLPKPWDTMAPPPAEAIGCMSQEKEMQLEWSRSYEVGDSPKAGYTVFYDQIKAKGWARQTDRSSTEPYEVWFERAGHQLRLFASPHVEDMGWITVEFTPARPDGVAGAE